MKLVNLHYHLEKFDIHHSYCEGYDEVSQSFKHTIYQDDSGKAITILKDEELLPEYVKAICFYYDIDFPDMYD